MFEKQNLKERDLTLKHWRWVLENAKYQKAKEIEIAKLSKAQKIKARDTMFEENKVATIIYPSQTFEKVMEELDGIIDRYSKCIFIELQRQIVVVEKVIKIFVPKYHDNIIEHLTSTLNTLKKESDNLKNGNIKIFLYDTDNKIKSLKKSLEEYKKWKEIYLKKDDGYNFIRYEIEEKPYTSNVIVGVYLSDGGKEKRKLIMTTFLPKKENDKILKKLVTKYNTLCINRCVVWM